MAVGHSFILGLHCHLPGLMVALKDLSLGGAAEVPAFRNFSWSQQGNERKAHVRNALGFSDSSTLTWINRQQGKVGPGMLGTEKGAAWNPRMLSLP